MTADRDVHYARKGNISLTSARDRLQLPRSVRVVSHHDEESQNLNNEDPKLDRPQRTDGRLAVTVYRKRLESSQECRRLRRNPDNNSQSGRTITWADQGGPIRRCPAKWTAPPVTNVARIIDLLRQAASPCQLTALLVSVSGSHQSLRVATDQRGSKPKTKLRHSDMPGAAVISIPIRALVGGERELGRVPRDLAPR